MIGLETPKTEEIIWITGGAEKISDYLGKFLSENYEFENYKNEEVYKSWEEELVKYNEYKNK